MLFPSRINYGELRSHVSFERTLAQLPAERTDAETYEFLVRAPRDWIFTSRREHTLALRVRERLLALGTDVQLVEVAHWSNLSPRTMIRHLDTEGTSFQRIRDGLRREHRHPRARPLDSEYPVDLSSGRVHVRHELSPGVQAVDGRDAGHLPRQPRRRTPIGMNRAGETWSEVSSEVTCVISRPPGSSRSSAGPFRSSIGKRFRQSAQFQGVHLTS